MSNIKATEPVAAILLSVEEIDAMRNAGGRGVSGHTTMTTLLASYGIERLVSRDSELTTMLKVASYEGAMMAGCECDLDFAKKLLTLSASTHKTAKDDEKRSVTEDRVYSLAKYNWSVSCDAVGLPKGGNGNARGSNAGKTGEATKDAPITVEAFHVPHGLDTEGAVNLFAKFQDAMRRALISDKIVGEAGSALRKCVDDVASYISDAHKALEADKPAVDPAEAMRAAILADLAKAGLIKGGAKGLAKLKLAA